jgi:hypothetical protein
MQVVNHNLINLSELDYIRTQVKQEVLVYNYLIHTIVLDYDFFYHRQIINLFLPGDKLFSSRMRTYSSSVVELRNVYNIFDIKEKANTFDE